MKNGYVLSDQRPLWGQPEVVGFASGNVEVRVIDKALANEVVRENHYSGTVAWASSENLGVFTESCGTEAMIGVLQFGPAMNPASGAKIVSGATPNSWLELNRMWIHDRAQGNVASAAISRALKYLKRARPSVQWVQSFADERCGKLGAVYQACSFLYCGFHWAEFYLLDGEHFHRSMVDRPDRDKRGWGCGPKITELKRRLKSETPEIVRFRQFRYIKFIRGTHRGRLLLPVLPYPKPEAGGNDGVNDGD